LVAGRGEGGDLVIDRGVGGSILVMGRVEGRSVVGVGARWKHLLVLAARVLRF
jgi:hypothetical protein